MQLQIFKYPPLPVFIALFAGMLSASAGLAPEFIFGCVILVGLVCVIALFRMPGMPGAGRGWCRRRFLNMLPAIVWPLLVISWLGIFRFQTSVQDPGGREFASVSGSSVSVVVKVDSVLRRDGDQVRAVAHVIRAGTPGIPVNNNTVLTLSCRSDRTGSKASVFCSDVVRNSVLAVRGHVSYSSTIGAVLYVSDRA